MLNNYNYFLTLTEELNISNAAKRLFISHQCLSKYLKGLEENYGVPLFERKPKFKLTPAGKILLQTFRQIELSEQNLENQFIDIKESNSGIINFGITEGRYSILVPKLLNEFSKVYPKVKLIIHRATSIQMQEMILNNSLDLFISSTNNLTTRNLKYKTVINENMYLVISDNLLKQYFSDNYPKCKKTFLKGVDLSLFQNVPFVLNQKNFNSRILLDKYLTEKQISLNCINEITQPDIHHLLCAEDYAASFCLTMYLSKVKELNKFNNETSNLNIFPIKDFNLTLPLALIYNKNKIFPAYIKDFKELIKKICNLDTIF